MAPHFKEIRIKGRRVIVPSVTIDDRTILALGRWVKVAAVHDENWVAGEVIQNPEAVVAHLKKQGFKTDLFTFPQRIPDVHPKFRYPLEWDNTAVIPLSTYADWWENRIPQETRKNVRRSTKRGVVVRALALDDQLIRGITEIYNETPVRQGKPFPKYGQSFETVKKDVSQLLDRSEFIAAYSGGELIGFVKLVYLGKVASILSINTKNKHFDKKPTNILIAKTIEICCQKGMTHLLYGRYTYGKKSSSPLTEFKRRNGFEKILIPRYYIPLTVKGKIVLMLNLHRGLMGVLPGVLVDFLVKVRSRLFESKGKRNDYAEQNDKHGASAQNA